MGEAKGHSKVEMRRRNLAVMLTRVQRSGAMSRSELTNALGLSRTTVLELSQQLAELGLVTEADSPREAGAGRPSRVVRASDRIVSLAVNPESDALTVGLVTLGGVLLRSVRIPTQGSMTPEQAADAAAGAWAALRDELPTGATVVGAGAAIPGQVAREAGLVLNAPRLGWHDVAFAEMLHGRLGMPVAIDNNARVVTATEHLRGVARDCSDFIYVFAGAGGIGGGVFSGGRPLLGRNGLAGEIGHVRLTADAVADFGGLTGTLEAHVRRDEIVDVLGGTSGDDLELDARISVAQGPEFTAIATRQLEALAGALGSLANVFDPQALVLGGFAGSLYQRLPEVFDSALAASVLPGIGTGLEVRTSVDTASAVLVGAAQLAFEPVLADPLSVVLVPRE
ncbi:ROK family transcriptional regulator [Demequina oxidasica]|uniref:ROK family transcriptional regulator n=1 Tax=Demequina oxidasica TaxID=676199 RepID=UPI000780DF3D|nr:ROK family transcriptional regulator [Demequina oxidasica]